MLATICMSAFYLQALGLLPFTRQIQKRTRLEYVFDMVMIT